MTPSWIDLKTGDLIPSAPKPALWFMSWEVLLPDANGDNQVFCAVPRTPERARWMTAGPGRKARQFGKGGNNHYSR
jgi:hypothetical protein